MSDDGNENDTPRKLLFAEATVATQQTYQALMNIRSNVEDLIEQQQPLRQARTAAIVRGDAKEAQRLFEEIRAIGREIEGVNNRARANVMNSSRAVRVALGEADE